MLCTLSLVDKLPAGAPLPELRWGYSEVKNYLLAACQLHRDWRAPLHDTRIMTGVGRWLLLLCQALARKARFYWRRRWLQKRCSSLHCGSAVVVSARLRLCGLRLCCCGCMAGAARLWLCGLRLCGLKLCGFRPHGCGCAVAAVRLRLSAAAAT